MCRLSILVLLAGCAVDYGLDTVVAGDDTDEGVGDDGDDDDGCRGWWCDPSVDSVPDLYFAVADAETMYTNRTSWAGMESVRYEVIDLRGRVVWDARLPGEPYTWQHQALFESGPGRVGIEAVRGWDIADKAVPNGALWELFQADAVSDLIQPVVHWDDVAVGARWTGVPEPVDVGPADGLVALAPVGDRGAVAFLLGDSSCALDEGGVRELVLRGEDGVVTRVPRSGFLPEALLHEAGGLEPWQVLASGQGSEASLLLVLHTGGCAESARTVLVAWSEREGVLWSHVSDELSYVSYSAQGGGHALRVVWRDDRYRWELIGSEGVRGGLLPNGWMSVSTGPILDVEGPTLALPFSGIGADGAYTGGIGVLHQGAVVWTIDELKDGLGKRPFYPYDIELVLPAE